MRLVAFLCVFSLCSIATAATTHFSSASVFGGTSDADTSSSPNSVKAEGILNNGFAFAKSDEYAINGWINDGFAVKTAGSYFQQQLTTTEFENEYGQFPGGGSLEVFAEYRFSLVGNAVSGGGITLRTEKLGGGIEEDNFSTNSPLSQSGTLHVVQSSCCTPFGVQIRLTGNVDAGGNSFGMYAASITEIRYNGQTVFVGPPPVPEPSVVSLAMFAFTAMPLFRRR
jgi:hypothetical protein